MDFQFLPKSVVNKVLTTRRKKKIFRKVMRWP